MKPLPVFLVSRADFFRRFFSFRLLLLAVEMLFFVFSFSRLRFLFSACVLALFVSCAGGGGGGGGGGTSPRAPFSFADESIVGMNVSIDGDYRELRSQRGANFSVTVFCSGVCGVEREVLFFRSLDDEISLQDEEDKDVRLLLNASTGAQELTVRFEAKRPGRYYYGVCIGEHCSAGVRLVVSGVAVTGVDVKFVVSGLAVLDVSADLVENDDRLNVTTALFCYGRQPCSDFPVDYYRATGEDEESFLHQEVPTLANDMAAEDAIEDIVTYIVNATYYGCGGPFSAEYCMSSRVRFDDEDGDGLSPRHDIDDDGDGLIELETAAQFFNIRYVLDGSGYQGIDGGTKSTQGCSACVGYELTADIDLASYGRFYAGGAGWLPVGTQSAPFTAIFSGNNFTVSNLYIARPAEDDVGLFGAVGATAELRDVHLARVNVTGDSGVGGLTGFGDGATIMVSSVAGTVSGNENVGGLMGRGEDATIGVSYALGTVSGDENVGGLTGFGRDATIMASYARVVVSGEENVGGLTGWGVNATVSFSYAAGEVSGNVSGGLVGFGLPKAVTLSYWDSDVSGITNGSGEPHTTAALQSPLAAADIYANWTQTCPQNDALPVWDFGTSGHYPLIRCMSGGLAAQAPDLPFFAGRVDLASAEVAAVDTLVLELSLVCAVESCETADQTVSFYLSRDAHISAEDIEIDSRSLGDLPSAGGMVRVAALLAAGTPPGPYYVGACLRGSCTSMSAVEELVVTGLGLVALTPEAMRVARGDSVEFDLDIYCFGSSPCAATLSYYRAVAPDTAGMRLGDLPVPEIAADTGRVLSFQDEADYAERAFYYVCLGSVYCTARVEILIDGDGDEVLDSIDVDDDGDGLIEIGTAEELDAMRYVLDGSGFRENAGAAVDMRGCPPAGCRGYELTADIDLASHGQREDGSAGWQPIGAQDAPFAAVFNGNNFTLSNLYIDRPAEDLVGFFGVLSGTALVRSVSLSDIEVRGKQGVGGLVGRVEAGGKVLFAAVRRGQVFGFAATFNDVGGLVGDATGATINASSFDGEVSGTGRYIGGLVGDGVNTTITASYAHGTVSGDTFVGGLVGRGESATITASYAAEDVSGTEDIGGLVGRGEGVTITASYAVGTVSGGNIGGLLGGLDSPAAVTASYWDSNVIDQDLVGFGEPRSTVQLQVPAEELRTAWEGQRCPGSAEAGVGFW